MCGIKKAIDNDDDQNKTKKINKKCIINVSR